MRKVPSCPPGSQEPRSLTQITSLSPITPTACSLLGSRCAVRSDSTSRGVAPDSGLRENCLSSPKVDDYLCARFLESGCLAAFLDVTTQWKNLRSQFKGRFDDLGASSYSCFVLGPPQAALFRETGPKHTGKKLFRAQN